MVRDPAPDDKIAKERKGPLLISYVWRASEKAIIATDHSSSLSMTYLHACREAHCKMKFLCRMMKASVSCRSDAALIASSFIFCMAALSQNMVTPSYQDNLKRSYKVPDSRQNVVSITRRYSEAWLSSLPGYGPALSPAGGCPGCSPSSPSAEVRVQRRRRLAARPRILRHLLASRRCS